MIDETKLLLLLDRLLGTKHKKHKKHGQYAWMCPFCNHYKPKLEIDINTLTLISITKWHTTHYP